MAEPPKFSDKTGHLQPNLSEKVKDSTIYHQFQRPASPLPSNASLKSDRSMAEPPKFSDKTDHLKPSLPEKVEDCAVYHQFQRPASPLPSNASLKSDRSMAEPPKFSDKTDYLKPGIFSLPEKVEDCAVYHQFQRPASPLPSNASLKSDRSMAEPPKFSDKTGHLQPKLTSCNLTDDFQLVIPERGERVKINSGSILTVSCHLSPGISAADMEITWFGEMSCICTYKNRETTQGVGYEGRASLFIHDLKRGNVSLRVADFRESDLGVYMCRVSSKNETHQITINVAEEELSKHHSDSDNQLEDDRMGTKSKDSFQLVVPSTQEPEVSLGSDLIIPCYLSPEISAVDMEISWSSDTACVCLYKDRHLTEGVLFKDRYYQGTLHITVIQMRNNVSESDRERVILTDLKRLRLPATGRSRDLPESDWQLPPAMTDDFQLVIPERGERVKINSGSILTVSCHLSPALSAADMEITWFGEMSCICTYKSREMTQGVGYEGRASLFIHDLKRGNVSLRVAEFRESDLGVYMCRVTSNNETQQITVNVVEEDSFQLVVPSTQEPEASLGSDLIIPCYLSPEISAVDMEITWSNDTACVCLYKDKQVTDGVLFKDRVRLFTHKLREGNVSLQLKNFRLSDIGNYHCQVISKDRSEKITIRVRINPGVQSMSQSPIFPEENEDKRPRAPTSMSRHTSHHGDSDRNDSRSVSENFQLVIPQTAQEAKISVGSEIIVPCHLSPEICAIAMKIKWFKETDCVCIYKKGQVIEGRSYKNRVNLNTHVLERGDVSLHLNNFGVSDVGDYFCQVISKDTTNQITVGDDFQLVILDRGERVKINSGSTLTVSCRLSPALSAVDMEITWLGETSCICTYKSREMTQGVGYEGRASLFIHDLTRGNVALRVADFRESDLGVYMCRVTSKNQTQQITVNVAEEELTPQDMSSHLNSPDNSLPEDNRTGHDSKKDFELVVPSTGPEFSLGSDFIIPCYLSPEKNAVDMEISWYKDTDCVYLYKDKQVIEGDLFKDRVSLIARNLSKGNVSLQLKNFRLSDIGNYHCQVISKDRREKITVRDKFHLVFPQTSQEAKTYMGSKFIVPCHLSCEICATAMQINWFKETDCVCIYKDDISRPIYSANAV
ncbi:butyrophilin 2 isoform X1 [Labeo rohita]|uniref:Butyrophilin 2 isoform X1 n=1 Tax=Labeo rohita TaxID=84645 RepID=A0A498NHE9_LABRO|nr:butyrophilin 2 isoform X1 [Labeo rohita]